MRYLLVLTMISLIGCVENKAKQPAAQIPVWHQTATPACNLTLESAAPGDFAITTYRTDLPFGRYDGIMSFRPVLVLGTNVLNLGMTMITRPGNENGQAYNWSPDGQSIVVGRTYEEPQHAMWEQANATMDIRPEFYRGDVLTYNVASNQYANLTAANQVSYYNPYGLFLPDGRVMFNAYIGQEMRGYVMNADGSNKSQMTNAGGFAYGIVVSPDNTRYTFHANYKVFVGDMATGVERQVQTPCGFNFLPVWAPDSSAIAFYCGTHADNDIWVADRDGQNARFISKRNYEGVVPFVDGPDYHGGGSDYIVWTQDSQSLLFGASDGQGHIEFYKAGVAGGLQKITSDRAWNAHGAVSNDGQYLVYTSGPGAQRHLRKLDLTTLVSTKLASVPAGCGMRYPQMRP